MEDDLQDKSDVPPLRPRGMDRRGTTHIGPPPFQTHEGLVVVERRSVIERRANWIHEFSLDTADSGSTNLET